MKPSQHEKNAPADDPSARNTILFRGALLIYAAAAVLYLGSFIAPASITATVIAGMRSGALVLVAGATLGLLAALIRL